MRTVDTDRPGALIRRPTEMRNRQLSIEENIQCTGHFLLQIFFKLQGVANV